MKKFKVILMSLIGAFFLTISIMSYNFLHNFYVVIPHKLYRSRELSKQKFIHVIKKYNIHSIINLRGAHPKKTWYQQEIAAINATNISLYNLQLSGYKFPKLVTLKKLIHTLSYAQYPILVHCNSGVDRTNLASMIALMLHNGSTLKDAKNQISWHYFTLRNDSVGKLVFQRYQKWLMKHHLQHSRKNFLLWVDSIGK